MGEKPLTGVAGQVRVGVDVARPSDVAASLDRFGDSYLQRVFTPREVADCSGAPQVRAARLAARFAAKEAVLKVLRPDDESTDWRSIEVRRSAAGWCEIHLTGSTARLAQAAGITDLSVALSHDGDLATAVVVGTCEMRTSRT